MKKIFFLGLLSLVFFASYAQQVQNKPDFPVTIPDQPVVSNAVNNTINVYPPATITAGKSSKGYNKQHQKVEHCTSYPSQYPSQKNEYWRGKYEGFNEGLRYNDTLKQVPTPVTTRWYDDPFLLMLSLLLFFAGIWLVTIVLYAAKRQQQPPSVTVHNNIPSTPPASPAPSAIVPLSKEELEIAMEKAKSSGSVFSRKADGSYEICFMDPKPKEVSAADTGEKKKD